MLHFLDLVNFKKHPALMVDFEPGFNVIKGPSYSGKTTLTYAIRFALFGARAVPGGSAALVHNDASDCSVSLTLDLPIGLVSITRTLKNASVRLVADGVPDQLLAAGHDPVTRFVADQLGLDLKKFNIVANSSQGETAALLTLGASALQRTVEDMAGFDLIDRVIALAQADVAQLDARLSARAGTVASAEEIERGAAHLEQDRDSFAALLQERAGLEARLAVERAAADQAQAVAYRVSQHNAEVAEAEHDLVMAQTRCADRLSDVADAERALTAASERLAALPVPADAAATAAALQAYGRQRDAADESRRAHGALARQIAEIEAWMPTAQKALADELRLREPIAEARRRLDEAVQEEARLTEQAQIVLRRLREARDAVEGGYCHACKRPFDVDEMQVARRRLAEVEAELGELTPLVSASSEQVAARHRALEELTGQYPGDGWEAEIAEQAANLGGLRERQQRTPRVEAPDPGVYDELVFKKRSAQAAAEAQERAQQAFAEARDRLAAKRYQLAEQTALRAAAHERVQHLGEVQDLNGALSEARKLLESVNELIAASVGLDRDTQALRAKITAETELLKIRRELRALHDRETEERGVADGLVRFLRAHRAEFLVRLWDGVLGTASEFCAAVTGGSMSRVVREEDAFGYVEGGRQYPMEAASGTMRAVAGVGLRLALESSFFATGGFLILDEPTADLDEEHAATLAGALLAQGRQIVMITHRNAEQYVCDQVIDLGEPARA